MITRQPPLPQSMPAPRRPAPPPERQPTGQSLATLVLRFGLVAHGILCWNASLQLWENGDVVRQPISIFLLLGLNVLGFVLMFLAASSRPPRYAIWILGLVIPLVFGASLVIKTVERSNAAVNAGTTDVLLFSDQAARFLRFGENPYQQDLSISNHIQRTRMVFSTPLLDGDFTGNLPYPSLSFLIYVPVQWLNVSPHFVYPLFLLLTLIALFLGCPTSLRPLIALPFLFDPHYLAYSFGGVSDIVWAFLLIMMVIQWRSLPLRAIWFGLACAFKQQPWFLLPFLAIRIWHETRDRPVAIRIAQIALFAALTSIVAALPNIPFMLWNFQAWFNGIMEPLRANMVIFGQGPSILMAQDYLNLPREVFSLLSYGTYLLMLVLYASLGRHLPGILWIMPAFALWLGHRSLSSYWYYFALPFVLDILRTPQAVSALARSAAASKSPRRILLVAAALQPVVVVGLLIGGAIGTSPLSIEVHRPIDTVNGAVASLNVTVRNHTAQVVTPRFVVQSWTSTPYYWQIVDGPQTLAPYEVGDFRISTTISSVAFGIRQGAQITVSDASDYDIRAAALISGDYTSGFFDPIANDHYEFWWTINGRSAPYGWGLMGSPADNIEYVQPVEDRPGVRLNLASGETPQWVQVMLDIWIPLPEDDLLAWINVPLNANRLPELDVLYGFEVVITRSDQRIWILYGDEASQGQLQDNLWYWMRPAPRGIWSLQTIDVRQILSDLELDLPVAENFVRYDVVGPTLMINFRLMGGARNQPPGALAFEFGPVQSRSVLPDPDEMTREYLAQPEVFVMWRGDYNLLARNYDKALDYYTTALELNPSLDEAHYRIALIDLIRNEQQIALPATTEVPAASPGG